MHFLSRLTSVLTLATGLVVAVPAHSERASVDLENPRTVQDFQALAIKSLEDAEASSQSESGGCTLANARVRRDW
jgi:hypothetical protein